MPQSGEANHEAPSAEENLGVEVLSGFRFCEGDADIGRRKIGGPLEWCGSRCLYQIDRSQYPRPQKKQKRRAQMSIPTLNLLRTVAVSSQKG